MIKILGAGLSGLSAAINLAKKGNDVKVFERKKSVGSHLGQSFQALRCDFKTPDEYFRDINLKPKPFWQSSFKKAWFLTRKRDIDIKISQPVHFVCRGGPNSLEYGLFREAESVGVKFEFETKAVEKDVNIVATGSRRSDIVAFGSVYSDLDIEKDRFLMMYDDRFSPMGWYFYIIPQPDGRVEVMNCVSQPYGPLVKKLFYKAIEQRGLIRDIVGDRKPEYSIGGVGNISYPKTAVFDGRLYTGEAAGFQDACYGFGMTTALESGMLAAESIMNGTDYDTLWKARLGKWIEGHLAKRFVTSTVGDRVVEHIFRKFNNGDVVDFFGLNSEGHLTNFAESVLWRMELAKKRITGYW